MTPAPARVRERGPVEAQILPAVTLSPETEALLATAKLPMAVPVKSPYPEISAPKNALADYDIVSDAVSNFEMGSDKAVFVGHVILKSKRYDIKAERLTVLMDPKKNELHRLIAAGKVWLKLKGETAEESYEGTATEATFDPARNTCLMTGWPRITGQSREHWALDSSTRMVLTTDKPKLVTEGRAGTRIASSQLKTLSKN